MRHMRMCGSSNPRLVQRDPEPDLPWLGMPAGDTVAALGKPSAKEQGTMAAETPTVVLVHGAWADATGFDAEIRALQRLGFRAIGFANPLRDLAGDSAYLAEFLRSLTGPIVLVGHSYGGNVISMAAAGNDQVKALVDLNGRMVAEGERHQELLEGVEGHLVGSPV